MNAIKDGGPVFPCTREEYVEIIRGAGKVPCTVNYPGMSLRDYFAARAMHAEIVTCGIPGEAFDALIEASCEADRTPELHMAFNAYLMADAMLAAREDKP